VTEGRARPRRGLAGKPYAPHGPVLRARKSSTKPSHGGQR
jgi:hypothetical protein